MLSGETWIKMFKKYYREVLLRVKVFHLLLNQALHSLDHSGAFMSTNENSRDLMSTHKYGAMVSWVIMSAP